MYLYNVYRVLSRENNNIRTSAKGCRAGVGFRLLQFSFNEIPVTVRSIITRKPCYIGNLLEFKSCYY